MTPEQDSLKKFKKTAEPKCSRVSPGDAFTLAFSSRIPGREFFMAHPYSDFKKLECSERTQGRIEIEFFGKDLVVITGKRLLELAIEISQRRIREVMESAKEPEGTEAWVESIEVVLLEDATSDPGDVTEVVSAGSDDENPED